ncbi:MAG: amino acid permease [Solirubrobacterales bacterium]|nr:amino acid permease [Solirubrobacterales bacterium]
MEATRAPASAATAGREGGLHRRALGVPDLVFFIVAASAPLTVIAGGVASTYLVTGNAGVPLLFLVLGAILALFVSGYAAMSHHITNAGAFYAYVAKGIGRIAGVGTSFVALIAYNSMQIGIGGLFGVAFGGFMLDKTGIDMEWYVWLFIAIGVIGLLGQLQVDLNAKVLAVFLTLEIVVVAIFDIAIAADPGPQGIVADGFDPSIAFGTALGAALTFTMAAFVGFESAAIYGEEVKNPRRTVARATYIALGITALFYALSAWMLGNAAGPDTATNPEALVEAGFVGASGGPDPTTIVFISLNERISATFADIATLLFCTSLFAAMLSFHNAVSRYAFSLGRAKVLPSVFGRVRPSTGAPYVGSLMQTSLAVVIVALFALSDSDPVLQLFTWLTNLGALGVILLLALASFSVVGYFARHPHSESAWTSRISPALAGVLLSAVFVIALLNFNVLITGLQDAPTDDRTIILPAILIGGGLIGVGVGAWLRAKRPEVYARIGEGGEEVAGEAPAAR